MVLDENFQVQHVCDPSLLACILSDPSFTKWDKHLCFCVGKSVYEHRKKQHIK